MNYRAAKFGPAEQDDPAVGELCPACRKPFVVGDYTTLIPLGPGDNPDRQALARAGTTGGDDIHKPVVTMHLVNNGFPICCFHGAPISKWPLGHIPIAMGEYQANASACRDPEHDIHAVQRYEICINCEAARSNPPEPMIAVEGRTCKRCGIILVPTWPRVYCTERCARLQP